MSRGGDRTSTSARLAAAERSKAALELRLRRMSYREIATRLGYTNAGAAWKAIAREIAKVPREDAKLLRTAELETLDLLQASVMTSALSGKAAGLWALDRVLAIMDRRARLAGLANVGDDTGVDEFKAVLVQWSRSLTAAVENDEREDEGEL